MAKKIVPTRRPAEATEISRAARNLQVKIHRTFCTLECASISLEKAENQNDSARTSRAASVVARCVEELENIRDDVDGLSDAADHAEASTHG